MIDDRFEVIAMAECANKDLRRISEFACECGVSTTAVYKWIKEESVTSVMIRGVCFIVMDSKAKRKIKD